MAWRIHTHDGHRYGPVEKSELDQWVAEGRLTANCQVSNGEGPWQSASDVFPVLRYTDTGSTRQSTNPYSAPTPSGYGPRGPYAHSGYLAPDRGGVILTLGILGLVVCGVLSIIAWVMGAGDLREIREGRMNPAGYGLTQAGMVLGIVGCVLMIVGVLIIFLVVAAGA